MNAPDCLLYNGLQPFSWIAMTSTSAATPQWGMAIDLERCIGCHACSEP